MSKNTVYILQYRDGERTEVLSVHKAVKTAWAAAAQAIQDEGLELDDTEVEFDSFEEMARDFALATNGACDYSVIKQEVLP